VILSYKIWIVTSLSQGCESSDMITIVMGSVLEEIEACNTDLLQQSL
jgi:hypothetical protein